MSNSSAPVRISLIKLLRRVGPTKPEYAFEKTKPFWNDGEPIVRAEVLDLISGLPSSYFERSLPLVRNALTQDDLGVPKPSLEIVKAIEVLAHALPAYPDRVFQVASDYLRQYFGKQDLLLSFGEYPLPQAYELICNYALMQPQTNVTRVVELIEERFKKLWSTLTRSDAYDGMESVGLTVGGVNFDTPSLHEDVMVHTCLISALLELKKRKPEQAREYAESLAVNLNAFARRASLHVALSLSVEGDDRADGLIERAFGTYLDSHEYLSVFQTAESFLLPLAERRPSLAMTLLKKLSSHGVEYLESFEIGALLKLAEAENDARDMMMEILEKGHPRFAPQIIKGTERLSKSQSQFTESILHLVMKRFGATPSTDIANTALYAAAALASASWTLAKPVFELAVKSPSWMQAADIAGQLAHTAKENTDARIDAKQMLQELAHAPYPEVRQATIMAVVELSKIEGPFGLDLLESLSTDPSPLQQEDQQLLEPEIRDTLVIRTVRGAVAWAARFFAHVDKKRCSDLLARLSADNSAYVRTMAIRNLARCPRDQLYLETALSLLLSGGPKGAGLLRDESAWVRHGALCLSECELTDDPKSIDALYSLIRNALQDTDPRVRSEAAKRVLDAAAINRDAKYHELLQEIAEHGTLEERSEVAFSVRSYMDKDERAAFAYFKPVFTKLISDQEREVREKAAISLKNWVENHPTEVAEWCCRLAETESLHPSSPFSGMAGYYIAEAFRKLVARNPQEAAAVVGCVEGLPDKYQLNEILEAAKELPIEFRARVQPIADRLLKQGLPAAQKLLDSWSKPQNHLP